MLSSVAASPAVTRGVPHRYGDAEWERLEYSCGTFYHMPTKAKMTDYLSQKPLSDTNATMKLTWLYIAEHGEDFYTVRGLAASLSLGSDRSVRLALDDLSTRGLVVAVAPGAGRRGARYRAVFPTLEKTQA
jgi:hypothetical protein